MQPVAWKPAALAKRVMPIVKEQGVMRLGKEVWKAVKAL